MQLRVVVEADSVLSMKDLVLQGLYTVLPHQVVHEELAQGSMSALRLVKPSRTPSLATSSHHPGTSATRAVWREIRDIVAGSLVRAVWR